MTPYRETPSKSHPWAVIPLSFTEGFGQVRSDVRWWKTKREADMDACRFGTGECVVGRVFR